MVALNDCVVIVSLIHLSENKMVAVSRYCVDLERNHCNKVTAGVAAKAIQRMSPFYFRGALASVVRHDRFWCRLGASNMINNDVRPLPG